MKSVTLYDRDPVQIADLSGQFFLHSGDVGKPRAEVTAPRLAELNSYTPVTVYKSTTDLVSDLSVLSGFQVVVLTEASLKTQLAVNDYCHQNKIAFISADIRGFFGNIFCDFGENFPITDTTGENVASGIIASIGEDGLVTALDETRHGLEDGDYVTFTEIIGLEALNDAEPRKVEVKGMFRKYQSNSQWLMKARSLYIFDWKYLFSWRSVCQRRSIYPGEDAKNYEFQTFGREITKTGVPYNRLCQI